VRGFWSVGIMAVILDSYGRWVKSWQQRKLVGSSFGGWQCNEKFGGEDWIVNG